MRAYVLINVRAGKCPAVVSALRKIKGIAAANACWGRPDIFAVVQAPSEGAFAETVLKEIQTIDGVESTDTHFIIE